MISTLSRFTVYLVSFFTGVFAGSALGASPRDELLRLVPSETTFTLLVQNLAEKVKTLGQSSFSKELQKVPLGKLMLRSQDPEGQKQFEQLLKDFDLTPEKLLFDLLGDAGVVVFRDRDPAQKDRPEELLVLLYVRDPKLMNSVMDRINAHDQKLGELKEVANAEYETQSYICRHKTNPKDGDEFYFIQGSIFAFSTSESLLRSTIDRNRLEPTVEKSKPNLTAKLEKLGIEKSLLVWWMDPRSFDGQFRDLIEESQGIEKTVLARFLEMWKGFDGLAIHCDFHDVIEAGATVSINPEKMPKSALPFFSGAGRPTSLWQIIPENALFAIATRIEGSSTVDMIAGLFDTTHQQQLEAAVLDLFRVFRPEQLRMLPNGIGPDIGLWVFDPLTDPKRKVWVPQMIFAVKLRSGSEGVEAGENLNAGLGILATLTRFMNSNITLTSMKDGSDRITYLIHDRGFPTGFRPAFASKGGYFLIAASPETIRNFAPPRVEDTKEESEVPFVRISLKGWHKFILENREPVSQFMAQGNAQLAREIQSQLEMFSDTLALFDSFEVLQRNRKDALGLVVRMKPSHSLRK